MANICHEIWQTGWHTIFKVPSKPSQLSYVQSVLMILVKKKIIYMHLPIFTAVVPTTRYGIFGQFVLSRSSNTYSDWENIGTLCEIVLLGAHHLHSKQKNDHPNCLFFESIPFWEINSGSSYGLDEPMVTGLHLIWLSRPWASKWLLKWKW